MLWRFLADIPWSVVWCWLGLTAFIFLVSFVNRLAGHQDGYREGWDHAWKDRTEYYKTHYIPKTQGIMPPAED